MLLDARGLIVQIDVCLCGVPPDGAGPAAPGAESAGVVALRWRGQMAAARRVEELAPLGPQSFPTGLSDFAIHSLTIYCIPFAHLGLSLESSIALLLYSATALSPNVSLLMAWSIGAHVNAVLEELAVPDGASGAALGPVHTQHHHALGSHHLYR